MVCLLDKAFCWLTSLICLTDSAAIMLKFRMRCSLIRLNDPDWHSPCPHCAQQGRRDCDRRRCRSGIARSR